MQSSNTESSQILEKKHYDFNLYYDTQTGGHNDSMIKKVHGEERIAPWSAQNPSFHLIPLKSAESIKPKLAPF